MAVRARLDTTVDLGEIPESAVESMLRISGRAEGTGFLVLAELPSATSGVQARPFRVFGLARRVGFHALERGDVALWKSVLARLDSYAGENETLEAVRTSAILASTACRFDVRFAKRALLHFVDQTKEHQNQAASVLGLWHVGGAALAVGAMSVAVSAARVVVERNQVDLLSALSIPENLETEKLKADVMGGYLGDDGASALRSFVSMAQSLRLAF
ncbi:hypothetical protein [Micromonospora chersina]|uniref:hypothetical protein n=1 Tax=Micromonospora chersina TaxID=47854 RepID=UPI0033A63431